MTAMSPCRYRELMDIYLSDPGGYGALREIGRATTKEIQYLMPAILHCTEQAIGRALKSKQTPHPQPMPARRYRELMRLLETGDATLEEMLELGPELERRGAETDSDALAGATIIVTLLLGSLALAAFVGVVSVLG